jgi:hypothetical protein
VRSDRIAGIGDDAGRNIRGIGGLGNRVSERRGDGIVVVVVVFIVVVIVVVLIVVGGEEMKSESAIFAIGVEIAAEEAGIVGLLEEHEAAGLAEGAEVAADLGSGRGRQRV